MGRRVGQRIDDLQLLDDRARPSVGDDERQGVLMLRADVDEVDVQPVDLGDELRQGVQPGFDLAPVVFRRPVSGEFLHRRQLHALRAITDEFPLWPFCRFDTAAQVDKLLFRHIHAERANTNRVASCRFNNVSHCF
jgi:hypothetical protein